MNNGNLLQGEAEHSPLNIHIEGSKSCGWADISVQSPAPTSLTLQPEITLMTVAILNLASAKLELKGREHAYCVCLAGPLSGRL